MTVISTPQKQKIFVEVFHDVDTESPVDRDVFSLVTFNMGSIYDGRFSEENLKPEDIGKTWWPLSCYRHGSSFYSIRGKETYSCPWDTTQNAGVLYITSGDPSEVGPDTTKAAECFIEEFNDWVNGDCWGYNIEYQRAEVVTGQCPCCKTTDATWKNSSLAAWSSCGGFIGRKYFVSSVMEEFRMLVGSINRETEFAANTSIADNYEVVLRDRDYGFDEIVDAVEELGFEVKTR